ncbi:cupin domain-containing protein [Streptomyces sp. NPDC001739]|uniref:cupin domain-containing protein n=1 Tax=unclassified Streptomyces TaxID=2593676 RepID=UPI0033179F68
MTAASDLDATAQADEPAAQQVAEPASSPSAAESAPPSFVVNIPGIADADLEPEPLDPAQIVSGAPEVTGKVLWESPDGRQIRGIWQITPGVVTDTEANELFVVVSGRATIEVEGGSVLEVGPGDACILREGDRTRWTVHETLRKAYHISL